MCSNTLNKALPIVAAAYGRKFGVEVQVGGTQACTNGQLIQLPSLIEGTDRHILAYGYLAHEAAHVRFTDFSNSSINPLERFLENVIEDVRIEIAMIQIYPGTRTTLDAVITHLIRWGRMCMPYSTQPPAELLGYTVLMLARYQYRQQQALAAHAEQYKHFSKQMFGASFVQQLEMLLSEIPRLESTADAGALSKRIMDLIRAVSKGEKPQFDDKSNPNDQNQSETPSSPTTTQNLGFSKLRTSSENQPTSARHAAKDALYACEKSLPADMFEIVGDLLQEHSDGENSVLPSLESFEGDFSQGQDALNRVRKHSAHLTTRLQGLVQSSQLTRTRNVRYGLRLSSANLHRAAVGNPKIFEVRSSQVRPNTALHLLVDLSGSMCHGEDAIALDAALALTLALEQINGVSQAVSVFPGLLGKSSKITGVLKHGEKVAKRAGAFVQSARGRTPMTEALWFGTADLLARPESRKVLIVLTDGDPDHRTTALSLISKIERAGIELIGIGIQQDVNHLFTAAIRIDNVANLKQELFRVAEQLFVNRKP